MTKRFRHIHGLLQHDDAEWYSRDPADETNDGEDAEKGEHNRCGIVMFRKIVDCGSNAKDNMQDTCYPDELFGECTSQREVGPGENQSDKENKDEEDDSVGVEGELISGMVDSTTTEAFIRAVPFERETGYSDEAEKGQYEL